MRLIPVKSLNSVSVKLSPKGFTLVELILTVAILAFAISGMLLLFTNCICLNEANRNLGIATSHAEFVMEDIRNSQFSTLKADINNGNWNWDTTAINAAGLTALNIESIATLATGTEPLDITVTVTWQDRTQRNRSLVLETLLGGS